MLGRVVLLLALGLSSRAADCGYLVVFTDGAFLQVEGVELLGGKRLRLRLPEGASLEVPLERIERVVAAVEAEPHTTGEASAAGPSCPFAFSPEPLPQGTPFAKEISAFGQKHDLHPRLLAAVVEVESGFNTFAVSPMGARGLMQLMPAVWLSFGLLEPHDPRQNLDAGAAHLRKLVDRFGRLDLALAAYNAGASVVEAYGGIPPFRETQNYVRRVLLRFCPQTSAGSL